VAEKAWVLKEISGGYGGVQTTDMRIFRILLESRFIFLISLLG